MKERVQTLSPVVGHATTMITKLLLERGLGLFGKSNGIEILFRNNSILS